MNYSQLIEINPKVMLGKPVIKGSRITVELIIEKLSAGESAEQILASHPRLKQEHILAALSYAADILKDEMFLPLSA